MIEATEQDKSQLIKILRNSFKDNGSVNYVINPKGDKDKRIEALMDYSINMCMAYGEVFMNESKTACALLLHPEQKKSNLIWDLQLVFRVIGLSRVFKVLQRESKINSFHPKELNSFFYLWFIGVDTSSQHQGYGSELLTEVIDYAKQNKRDLYLETSTLRNLPWYQKHGFQIYKELSFASTLYMLSMK